MVTVATARTSARAAIAYPKERTALVQKHFPGAKGADAFLVELQNELRKHGLHSSDTIALANLCRDEATDKLKGAIDNLFNDSFNINGLGGVLTCGVTGVKAALSHSPQVKGTEQYIFFSFPHVAVDAKAGLGKIQRPGRESPSSACGALIAALGAVQSQGIAGLGSGGLDGDDLEFSVLKQKLSQELRKEGLSDTDAKNLDLAALTKLAERAITDDLEGLIAKAVDISKSNYAVVTGVQIHSWAAAGEKGPSLEYVWIQKAYVVVGGKRTELASLVSKP